MPWHNPIASAGNLLVDASFPAAIEENSESNEKAHAWLSRNWHLKASR
jgi:hypothetical protein